MITDGFQAKRNSSIHVAYVLLRFPCLTETFVAEEIRGLQYQGANIHLYSLLPARDKLIHPVSRQLLSQVGYAPALYSPSLLLAQVYYLFKHPVKYFFLFATILRQPAPGKIFFLKRIAVFLKSIWLARCLENTSVQLVHTHFAWLSAIAGIVISQLLNIPFTVTTHAYDIYSEKSDLLAVASHFADRVITISEANKKFIHGINSGLDPAKIRVIHCGIDLDYFHPCPEKSIDTTFQITSVGSLISKKGHEYLIRACSLLQKQQLNFRCVIIGNGSLEQSLKKLIHELGLENRVTLAGAQSQGWVRDRLAQSDLFVLACVTENEGGRDGIPVAMMEAMAMAVPVISTPVSGISELIRNENTGLLVPERDEQSLATAIFRMTHDDLMRQTIIKNGLELVNLEYDIKKNTRQLSVLFENLIGERHSCLPYQA